MDTDRGPKDSGDQSVGWKWEDLPDLPITSLWVDPFKCPCCDETLLLDAVRVETNDGTLHIIPKKALKAPDNMHAMEWVDKETVQ